MALNNYKNQERTVLRAKLALERIIKVDEQVIEGVRFLSVHRLDADFRREINNVIKARMHEIMREAIGNLEREMELKRREAVREALLFVGEHYQPEDGPEIEDE